MRKSLIVICVMGCIAAAGCKGPGLTEAQKDEVADIASDSSIDPDELQSKLDELETRLDATEATNSELEARVASLESEVSNLRSQVGY